MKRLWKTLPIPWTKRRFTRTISCKFVVESDGINETEDDAI
jgi:hypothetical protein